MTSSRPRKSARGQRSRPAPGRRKRDAPGRFFALVAAGIEDLAADELTALRARPGDTLAGFDRRDSIVLFRAADAAPVLRARLLEDVFALLLDVETPAGRRAPAKLAGLLDRQALERALAIRRRLRPAGRSYHVIVRVAGAHAFRREDVRAAFLDAMASLLPHWRPAAEGAAVELWVHVVGERTIAGLRLSDDALAQRGYKRAHLPASLKPTVAGALVILSQPGPGERVLDPMCGAGTILRERADAGRAVILGGDVDPVAVEAARENAGRVASLALWDARRLPLRDECIDCVICNPPYGRQHEATAGVDRLYRRVLRECARVLRPGGRCVILTGQPAALLSELPASIKVRARRRLIVRGLSVTAFAMVKR